MADKKETAKKAPAKKVEAKKKAAPKTRASKGAATDKADARPQDYAILLAPVVTEKSSLAGSNSASGPGATVVFRVDPRSNKDEIREAVERVFKVDVIKVRTANFMGKMKKTTRAQGRRAATKKAYITIKEGQSISVVEGL